MNTKHSQSITIIFLIILSVLQFGCPTADETDIPPTVKIESPEDNADILSGNQVEIQVTASDKDGMVNSLYIGLDNDDIAHFGPGYGPTYIYTWDTEEVTLGGHKIYAKAIDSERNGVRDEINLEIYEGNLPPVAVFTIEPAFAWSQGSPI